MQYSHKTHFYCDSHLAPLAWTAILGFACQSTRCFSVAVNRWSIVASCCAWPFALIACFTLQQACFNRIRKCISLCFILIGNNACWSPFINMSLKETEPDSKYFSLVWELFLMLFVATKQISKALDNRLK